MHIDWSALGLVLVISVVAGGGLVTLVALGITALDHRAAAHARGRGTAAVGAAAVLCFLGAAALIGYGLYLVVATR